MKITHINNTNILKELTDKALCEGVGGGTLGAGINQWNTNNPVSYEHVLDEVLNKVLDKWANWVSEDSLNELSIDKMQAYKDKVSSPQTFKTRALRKLPNGVEGNAAATRKINSKMDQRAGEQTPRATFEDASPEEIAHTLKIRTSDVPALYALMNGKIKFNDLPQAVRFALYNQYTDMPFNTGGGQEITPGFLKKLHQIVSEEESLQEVDMNQFADILGKQHSEQQATKKVSTKEIPYHGWTIRYRPAATPGEKVQWQVMDKKNEIKGNGEALNDKDAVSTAEDYIKKGGGAKQNSTDKVTIDFNVNFTREFGDEFFANIVADNSGPALLISYQPTGGMKKSYARNQKEKMTASTTKLTCIPLSAKEANDAGLQPNGRYILGSKNDLGDGIAMFPLIYQSTVQGKGDMMKMGKPGLTVAHNREVSKSEMDEAITPWGGYTADDKKANALANSPKSSMQGNGNIRLSDMIKDSIDTHGLKWAFEYYVKKHGLPPKHFQILAGLVPDTKLNSAQIAWPGSDAIK